MARDRTPAVVRATTTPSTLLVAGGAVAVGLLIGAGVVGAVLLGLLAGAGRVAFAALRRPRPERVDPFTIGDPWRRFVQRAQSTRRRFEDAVDKTRPGPLQDRLRDVGRRIEAAVGEVWEIAKRGDALDAAVSSLGIEGIRGRLARAEATPGPEQDAVVQSLRNQLASAERLARTAEDARSRLSRINAELEEAVARAVELSMSAVDIGAVQPLGGEVEQVVDELESLRLALEETG